MLNAEISSLSLHELAKLAPSLGTKKMGVLGGRKFVIIKEGHKYSFTMKDMLKHLLKCTNKKLDKDDYKALQSLLDKLQPLNENSRVKVKKHGIIAYLFTQLRRIANLGFSKKASFETLRKNIPKIIEEASPPPKLESFSPEEDDTISTFSPEKLTAEEIQAMSPDEKGDLIDKYAKRKGNGLSVLSQKQLQALGGIATSEAIRLINTQEKGLGHCGRYVINNSLQKEALSTDEFLQMIATIFQEKLGMSATDANALVKDNDDFGVDIEMVQEILKKKFHFNVKISPINDLLNKTKSKQKALETYVGDASWAIIANIGKDIYNMPSPRGAIYPLTKGHLVALKKDSEGNWWYLDSRSPKPVAIDLALIPRSCTLLVPI